MFWLNVNEISLGKIKKKTPQQTHQFATLETIRGLVSLVPKCFSFGDDNPRDLCKSERLFIIRVFLS